jgi:hypothetical protein
MPDHPIDPIKKIAKALQKEGDELGLEMQSFVVIPDMTGDAHLVQSMHYVRDEHLTGDPVEDEEVAKFLAEFEEHERKLADEAKMNEATERAKRLSERLGDGGSFLDDE